MGCHYLNTPFRALKLTAPYAVEATSTRVLAESAPLASMVTLDFAARSNLPALRMVWYDGGLRPPMPQEMRGKPLPEGGALYLGERGSILDSRILQPDLAARFEDLPKTLPRRGGTWDEWWQACKGGEPAGCNFNWAGPLTETVLLGNLAIRAGKPIEWDAAKGEVTNLAAANRFVREPYENGWTLDA
jgi:hypothetical protein